MPFGFSSSTNAMSAGAAGLNTGPDLETIQTEALGFLSIAGDAKVRLTSSWSSLPAATSSLLSIASRKGLVAAAGPDQIVIATTESIRKAFEAPKDGDSDIRSFEPQLKIPMPMRVSQLAFTADENYLVLSAESGGGLAVYEVQSLLQGSSNSIFELSTNGEALRALIPNPTTEKAELCAIVTTGGNLHMANLKERKISNSLKNQVSCISWSAKGKQLCAGLADGTIHQMTPEGDGKADIPKPPSLENCHVSSLLWLENNIFLAIYSTAESPPSSTYQVITRQPPSSFNFQKLTDPVEPFGSDKVPHHSILRLRDFPPDLQDLLIVSSTASTDVGLLTRSKSALANDKPADSITGVFTTTELLDDSKRPTLPMTDSMDDSTPIGIALDLSSKTKVYKPIPSDEELEESPGPLPGFWILTHEGVLCSWWVIYADSIKKETTYPGMAAVQESAPEPAPTASAAPFSSSASSPFGSSSTTTAPAFGSSSQIGQKQSPWAAVGATSSPSSTGGVTFGSTTFGTPASSNDAFGKPSTIGFGQSSQLGMRASPWTAAGGSTASFSQSAFSSFANNSQSPFGSAVSPATPSAAPSSGGFAGFASQNGFASLAGNNSDNSIFGSGSKPSGNVFGSGSADTAFPPKQDKPSGNIFGAAQDTSSSTFGSAPFKLQSSFKSDLSAKEETHKSPEPSGSSMFGGAFGSALSETGNKPPASPQLTKDEDMDTMESTEATPQAKSKSHFPPSQSPESTTPTTTPAPWRYGSMTSTTPPSSPGGLFGSKQDTPKAVGLFGTPKPAAQKKIESETPASKMGDKADSHLPPDTTSKAASFSPTARPGVAEDAPLPHAQTADAPATSGFVKVPRPGEKPTAIEDAFPNASKSSLFSKPSNAAPPSFILPKAPSKGPSDASVPGLASADEGESDLEDNASEGSGVDVAKDLSASTSGLDFTPQSSFGGLAGTAPAPVRPEQDRSRQLFGEVARTAPLIPRPTAASPRSPSPMRGAIPSLVTRSDTTRSVSAPGMTSQVFGQQKSHLGTSVISREKPTSTEDTFLAQHRKLKERQEAEEGQLLIDEEDDEVQRVLASEIEGTLDLDEFIAHSNVAPPAKESIPAQVEAVYRDINSMIDTLGLNARAVKSFTKGHTEGGVPDGRVQDDFEDADDWVLCEISDLGEILESDLHSDLDDGRVQDLADKLETCQDLGRDMHRLRAKQEDLRKVIMAKVDPDQADITRTLPLSAEQAAQQNELRREFTNFTKLLAEAEEALTLLKARIASISSSSGKGTTNVPTVEAVMRTITKMTSMVEKRSGDIDVLETQLRKMRLDPGSREDSPLRTPQARRSILLPPDATPSRSIRYNLTSSVMSLGASVRATPPRKKLSGFSKEEKGGLMDKRAKRQAVLEKLKESVQKKGVNVWNMEDIE